MSDVVPKVIGWLNRFQEKTGFPQKDYGLDAEGQVYQYLFSSIWIPDTKEMTLVYSDRGAIKLGLEKGVSHDMINASKDWSGDFEQMNAELRLLLNSAGDLSPILVKGGLVEAESEPVEEAVLVQENNQQIIHVPAFWPALEPDVSSSQSVGTIDNLPAIQARLKAGGQQLEEVVHAD